MKTYENNAELDRFNEGLKQFKETAVKAESWTREGKVKMITVDGKTAVLVS